MNLRKFVFSLHQIAGLVFGLILLIIGLTGSAIVFWKPIDRALNPEMYRPGSAPAASLERLMAAARKAHPNLKPEGVSVQENHVYSVSFTTPEKQYLEVAVDPVSYEVRASRVWEHSLVGVLYRLHYTLLAGEVGGWITGIAAVALLALGITGVVLWPGWKKWQAGTKLRWSANSRILSYDLHKLTGITTSVFMVILGLSGAYFMFNAPFKAAVYALTGTPQTKEPMSTIAAGAPLSPDTVLAKARPMLAGAEFERLRLAVKPTDTVDVFGRFKGEGPVRERLHIHLDQYSGRVLQVEDGRKPNTADFLLGWLATLHFGHYGGLFTQIMYVFVGLAPGGLFLTGFWLWLKKLRQPAAHKARSPQATPTR
ncbi:MAG: PepSY domain-containing protein [Aphanocapsa lilacina HA4352-LM1]|jgi:uncharacterized iron-regulated membrane protein|nr:PepSY domain-containing protein [Aphanocapsa lilacina HA4352-LM1]